MSFAEDLAAFPLLKIALDTIIFWVNKIQS